MVRVIILTDIGTPQVMAAINIVPVEQAIMILKSGMADEIVRFAYTKADGSIRTAMGTLNQKYFKPFTDEQVMGLVQASQLATAQMTNLLNSEPQVVATTLESDPEGFVQVNKMHQEALQPFLPKEKKASTKVPNPDVVHYYDIEAVGWRQFKIDSLLTIY